MLEKGRFKLLPSRHRDECILHVITLKQSLKGSKQLLAKVRGNSLFYNVISCYNSISYKSFP